MRAASQTGEDRIPLSSDSVAPSSGAMSPSTSQYPMLLKYSRYDDPVRPKYNSHPKYSEYKSTAAMSDVKGAASHYDDPESWRYRPRYRPHGLAPSASFSSFSSYKSDFDNYKPNHNKYANSSQDISRGGGKYQDDRNYYNNSFGSSKNRHAYGSSKTSNLGLNGDYGLKSAYSTPGHLSPTLSYDKVSSRYKPSRFLKSKLATSGCNEEEEYDDDYSLLSKTPNKKSDYYSHYTPLSPSLAHSRSSDNKNSPTQRRRHVETGGGGMRRNNRPVTVPETETPRESTSSIMNRYSGLSNSGLTASNCDTDSASNASTTPDSLAEDSQRRKERAQLINMYSLPLDVLQNIGSTHNRKFRKRGKDTTDITENNNTELLSPSANSNCYDKVKQMAAQVSCFGTYNNCDEEGSLGPPRKVLYGSASTGDMLSVLSKNNALKTAEDETSKTNTPDSEKFVLHEAPIVFEKAAIRDRPSRPTFLNLQDKAKSSVNTCDNTPVDSPCKPNKSLLSTTPLYSLLDSTDKPYILNTPNRPSVTMNNYLENDSEPTFSTFKPQTITTPQGNEITYMPAIMPKVLPETVSVAVKPKTATITTTTLTDISTKPKIDIGDGYSILDSNKNSNDGTKVKSGPMGIVPSRKVYSNSDLGSKSSKSSFATFFGTDVSLTIYVFFSNLFSLRTFIDL